MTRRLRTRNTTARETKPLQIFSSRVAPGFLRKKWDKGKYTAIIHCSVATKSLS